MGEWVDTMGFWMGFLAGTVPALALGWLLAWLTGRGPWRRLEAERDAGREQCRVLETERNAGEAERRALEEARVTAETERVRLETRLEAAEAMIRQREGQIGKAAEEYHALADLKAEAEQNSVRLKTGLEAAEKRLKEKEELLVKAREELTQTFKALSSEALDTNNRRFLELAKEQMARQEERQLSELEKRKTAIGELVQPMRERLEKMDTAVRELEKARVEAFGKLDERLGVLKETGDRLNRETGNLVAALRQPSVRGQWGQLQLKRVAEFAGMTNRCDFEEEFSVNRREGDGRYRPDMIVRLPQGRSVIVDAKAPLEAYLNATQSENQAESLEYLKTHARQIRDHVKALGQKKYWEQFDDTPEFVILFLPNEALFSAALEADPDLLGFGADKRVILATPTTLISLLLAVSHGWRQFETAERVEDICRLGNELCERLNNVIGYWDTVGKNLDKAVDSFNKAVNSLESRVLVTGRKFAELAQANPDSMKSPKRLEQNTRQLRDR